MITVRFWNTAGECVNVAGKYAHTFNNMNEARKSAEALLTATHDENIIEVDFDNSFFDIIWNEENEKSYK